MNINVALIETGIHSLIYLFLGLVVWSLSSVFAWWLIDSLTPIDMREQIKDGHTGAWLFFGCIVFGSAVLIGMML